MMWGVPEDRIVGRESRAVRASDIRFRQRNEDPTSHFGSCDQQSLKEESAFT